MVQYEIVVYAYYCLTARANTSKTQIMADSMMQVLFGQVDADRLELLASV